MRLLLCCGLLAVLPWNGGATRGMEGGRVTDHEVQKAIGEIWHFLHTRMTDKATGGIYVNAVDDRPVVAGEARNHEILSEAVGQMMELALLRDDRGMFERQFRLTKDRFLDKESGFLAWKISLDPPSRGDTSATLDDWRVAWASRVAADRWDWPEAAALSRALAKRIAAGSKGMTVPPPAFNLADGSPGSGSVLLCYLHLPAMKQWSREVPGCGRLYENSLNVLRGIEAAPGMVPARWNPETSKYSTGTADEVLALITLLYLQECDPENPRLREAIELRVSHFRKHGHLPQAFEAGSGEALPARAGASVYALWIRLLLASGRPATEAEGAVRCMLEFQNGADSKFPGAIGEYPVYSFDQLEVLLALEQYRKALKDGGSSGHPAGHVPES